MLETLRKSASGWIAKILIGLLVVSFAIWGIEDVFRGYRQGELAKVGNITVTNTEFEQAFRREIDMASNQFRRRLTQEEARLFGIDQRTLDNLVGSATIDNHTAALNLAVPNEKIVEDVQSTPSFQGLGGQFDRPTFNRFLQQIGLSEKAYAEIRRKEMLRTHVTSAMLTGLTPPQVMIDMLHLYQGEQRVVEHFEIASEVLPKIADPNPDEVKKFYEDRKTAFVRPEYRKLNILLATADTLKDRTTVSDVDVKKTYEATKANYNQPERRRIQQIPFPNKEAASVARKKLASGKSFADIATAAGAKDTDINLGLMTQAELFDPAIAKAAFALKKDQVSEPVEGKFTTVLVRVTEIQPAVERTYDDVKDIIRTNMQRDKARAEAQKVHDQVDELRLSGKSLKEIAEASKLRFLEIEAIDKAGKTPAGANALDIPDLPALITAAFQSEVGLENESLQSADGGYIWYDVLAITAERQKEFKEVETDAKRQWQDNEMDKALSALATKLVEKADAGAPMTSLAKEAGGSVKTSDPVRRSERGGGLTQRAIQRAFSLAKGKTASVPTDDAKSRIILRVKDVLPPKPANTVEAANLSELLVQDIRTDTVAAYVGALQKHYKVDINKATFDRLSGRTTTPVQ